MGVTDILEIGKQGLDSNRQGLTTSSNNVANANTPGYTRQRAVLATNDQPIQGKTCQAVRHVLRFLRFLQ